MEKLLLTKDDVLTAFDRSRNGGDSRTPAFMLAAELGIKPQAIYQWSDKKEIPAARQLRLYQNRPDIIQYVKDIQSRRGEGLPSQESSTPEQDSVEMKRFDTADNSAELRRFVGSECEQMQVGNERV